MEEKRTVKFPDGYELTVTDRKKMDHNRLDLKRVEDTINSVNLLLIAKLSLREQRCLIEEMLESWNRWCIYDGQNQLVIMPDSGLVATYFAGK